MSLLELLFKIRVLFGPLSFKPGMLSVTPLNLLLHALLPLLGKKLLLFDLLLHLLLAVGYDLINLDHHDLEQVVYDQGLDDVALVTALNPHELLDHLKDFEEEHTQVRDIHLQGFFLANHNVAGGDLITQELFDLVKKGEMGCSGVNLLGL